MILRYNTHSVIEIESGDGCALYDLHLYQFEENLQAGRTFFQSQSDRLALDMFRRFVE